MASNEEVLGKVSIFSMLKPKELKKLAQDAHECSYTAGTTLTETDELGTTFFVVVDGSVTVNVGAKEMRVLKPGDFFGEMALIDHQPRAATVRADTDSTCLVFSGWVFRPFALAHPEVAWALLEHMVARVRDVNGRAQA